MPAVAKWEIIQTADGSPTLWSAELDESYHSKNGAVQESMHVFIDAGLRAVELANDPLVILEIGMGTGLNAALTASWCQERQIGLEYIGLEPYPVELEVLRSMNFEKILPAPAFEIMEKIALSDPESSIEITPGITISQRISTIQQFDRPTGKIDLVYYDAFAPEVQPELWDKAIFAKLKGLMSVGAKLVTYCAKGQVRRDLQAVGFEVEKLNGPPGKRHMLRATKVGD